MKANITYYEFKNARRFEIFGNTLFLIIIDHENEDTNLKKELFKRLYVSRFLSHKNE